MVGISGHDTSTASTELMSLTAPSSILPFSSVLHLCICSVLDYSTVLDYCTVRVSCNVEDPVLRSALSERYWVDSWMRGPSSVILCPVVV